MDSHTNDTQTKHVLSRYMKYYIVGLFLFFGKFVTLRDVYTQFLKSKLRELRCPRIRDAGPNEKPLTFAKGSDVDKNY